MVRKTRKVGKTGKTSKKGMTVPQLRSAFERINTFIQKHGEDVEAFRKEWKKVFGKSISANSAREYFKMMSSKKGQKGQKTQKGGVAPLDYDLRAGTDIPYGSFPKYVSDGFGFANEDSIAALCGKENITPNLPADMGSNKVGGSRKTRKSRKMRGGNTLTDLVPTSLTAPVSEFMSRPFQATIAPSYGEQAQFAIKGYNPPHMMPSGKPEVANFDFTPQQPVYSSYLSKSSVKF
jgi:hypothetical protein